MYAISQLLTRILTGLVVPIEIMNYYTESSRVLNHVISKTKENRNKVEMRKKKILPNGSKRLVKIFFNIFHSVKTNKNNLTRMLVDIDCS